MCLENSQFGTLRGTLLKPHPATEMPSFTSGLGIGFKWTLLKEMDRPCSYSTRGDGENTQTNAGYLMQEEYPFLLQATALIADGAVVMLETVGLL